MSRPKVGCSLGRARSALVSTTLGHAHRAALTLAVLAVLIAHATAPSTAAAQQSPARDPLSVVDTFLAARNAGDYWAAAGECAPLLELQDIDGSWFVETATTSDWLRQLTAAYLLDTLTAPVADGNIVSWTERLTPRNMHFPEALSSSMTLEVHAVIRDGKIGYLSAPYPPLPLKRPPDAAASEPSVTGNTATVAPATMFLGSALGLTLTALLLARGAPAVSAAFRRRSSRRGPMLTERGHAP